MSETSVNKDAHMMTAASNPPNFLKCQVRASAFQQKGPKIKSLQQLQQQKVKLEKLRGQNAITAQVTFKCCVQIIRSNAILRLR